MKFHNAYASANNQSFIHKNVLHNSMLVSWTQIMGIRNMVIKGIEKLEILVEKYLILPVRVLVEAVHLI